MLSVYIPQGNSLEHRVMGDGEAIPEAAVWIDLLNPSYPEDKFVAALVGIEIPTREEMQEIEISSRLYFENGARFMTATLISQADTQLPKVTPVTFILVGQRLVTVRYDEPRPFDIVRHKLAKACPPNVSGHTVLLDLLDAIIDRAADILERVGTEVDRVSYDIFSRKLSPSARSLRYPVILQTIGRKGDLSSKVRESLVSIMRLVLFLANEEEGMRWPKEMRVQLKTMQRDVQSLLDHTTFLTNNITFLLDGMIGVVTIEQNDIIKIFSVAAVIFMPPTLVASIYGMNFKLMPELNWSFGYPFALFLMISAAVLPFVYFKWRKWL